MVDFEPLLLTPKAISSNNGGNTSLTCCGVSLIVFPSYLISNGENTVSNGMPSSALGLVATGGGHAQYSGGGKPGGSGGGGWATTPDSFGLAFGQQNNSNGYAWSPSQGNQGGAGKGPMSSGWWATFYHGLGGGGGYAWMIGAALGAIVHLAISSGKKKVNKNLNYKKLAVEIRRALVF